MDVIEAGRASPGTLHVALRERDVKGAAGGRAVTSTGLKCTDRIVERTLFAETAQMTPPPA